MTVDDTEINKLCAESIRDFRTRFSVSYIITGLNVFLTVHHELTIH